MLSRLISPKILSIPHHANLGSFGLLTEEKTTSGTRAERKARAKPLHSKRLGSWIFRLYRIAALPFVHAPLCRIPATRDTRFTSIFCFYTNARGICLLYRVARFLYFEIAAGCTVRALLLPDPPKVSRTAFRHLSVIDRELDARASTQGNTKSRFSQRGDAWTPSRASHVVLQDWRVRLNHSHHLRGRRIDGLRCLAHQLACPGAVVSDGPWPNIAGVAAAVHRLQLEDASTCVDRT